MKFQMTINLKTAKQIGVTILRCWRGGQSHQMTASSEQKAVSSENGRETDD
jgi:hypothetical protein